MRGDDHRQQQFCRQSADREARRRPYSADRRRARRLRHARRARCGRRQGVPERAQQHDDRSRAHDPDVENRRGRGGGQGGQRRHGRDPQAPAIQRPYPGRAARGRRCCA